EDLHYLVKAAKFEGLNLKKLQELIEIIKRLPVSSRIEMGGDGHIATFTLLDHQLFDYYDPNFDAKFHFLLNSEQLPKLFIQTKIKAISGSEISRATDLSIYSFPWDKIDLTEYRFFNVDELPRSKADAIAFQK